jgi:hypothetical protein
LTEARNRKPETRKHTHSGLPASGFPASGFCLFIEGDPIRELRQGRDPFCNAPVLGTHPYCARHCLRAYYQPEE